MSNDKGFRHMSRIVAELQERITDIEQGRLDLEHMDQVLADLRELEERIIVIRYKGIEKLKRELRKRGAIETPDSEAAPTVKVEEVALEAKTAHQSAIPSEEVLIDHAVEAQDEEEEIIKTAVKETEAVAEEAPMEHATPEPSNQISLIDSIEEMSREASINEKMKEQSGPTLAQKLSGSKVAELSKAFSLNERIGIVKELFGGDEAAFKNSLVEFENAGSLAEALSIAEAKVGSELWSEEGKNVLSLKRTLERRFA